MSKITKAISDWVGSSSSAAKASRATMGSYVAGVAANWGQPQPGVASNDVSGLITPYRMREIVLKTPTAAACTNAILDYAGGVAIDFRNLDPSIKPAKKDLRRMRRLMASPNLQQTGRQFKLALIRDLITLGYAAVELDRDGNGVLQNMWVMDAARLRIDFDEHGTVKGYNMLDARGVPIVDPSDPNHHGWEPQDVMFFSLNPMSESVYPYSRITQLFSAAVLEDLMIAFIAGRFTESNAPFGIYDMGDITEDELIAATTQWQTQANQQHRIILTGSKNGGKFVPFGYHLKDLEATNLLHEVQGKVMSITGVTMNELGDSQDINKSNGYNLSYTFKKRAIEPVLNEITETLTKRLLWEELGMADMEAYYQEIDSRDQLVQAQIDKVYFDMGVDSRNTIANRKGLPDMPGGEEFTVYTGQGYIPLDLVRKLAQGLIDAEAATQQIGMTADGAKLMEKKPEAPPQQGPAKPDNGVVHATRAVTGSK